MHESQATMTKHHHSNNPLHRVIGKPKPSVRFKQSEELMKGMTIVNIDEQNGIEKSSRQNHRCFQDEGNVVFIGNEEERKMRQKGDDNGSD